MRIILQTQDRRHNRPAESEIDPSLPSRPLLVSPSPCLLVCCSRPSTFFSTSFPSVQPPAQPPLAVTSHKPLATGCCRSAGDGPVHSLHGGLPSQSQPHPSGTETPPPLRHQRESHRPLLPAAHRCRFTSGRALRAPSQPAPRPRCRLDAVAYRTPSFSRCSRRTFCSCCLCCRSTRVPRPSTRP
jgi:hypothetical protein